MVAGKKHPKLVLEGHEFEKSIQSKQQTLWRCTKYYKTRCPSRLVTLGNRVIVRFIHNHSPMMPNIDRAKLLRVKIIKEL